MNTIVDQIKADAAEMAATFNVPRKMIHGDSTGIVTIIDPRHPGVVFTRVGHCVACGSEIPGANLCFKCAKEVFP